MAEIATSGKRKCSIAKITLKKGEGKILVNRKDFEEYFRGYPLAKHEILRPLLVTSTRKNYDCIAHVSGGGISGQAQAIRHGISKALLRAVLRKEGLLTRDSRIVERKKPGQPKARKRFQYSKR